MSDDAAAYAREIERLRAKWAGKLPLVTSEIAIGDRLYSVTAVQNQDILLDAAEEMEHIPYGFLLWEAAVGLARFLAAHPTWVAGKRVLELGAGLGLPGMVARTLGAQVGQTDHLPGTLALAQVNAHQNGITGLTWFVADWQTWTHAERYDILLGADILYERAMHFYLEAIFQRNLAPGGKLLLSDPSRPQALEFAAHLEKSGWQIGLEMQKVTLPEAGPDARPVEVGLLIGTRRS
jgi:predicted nicotinamide N-methyase